MQNRINTKAQSNVVATVIIVALSIVLVGILFYSINNLATPALSPVACTEENLDPSVELTSVCLDQDKSQIQITLDRKITSSDISTIDFNFKSDNTNGKWRCFAGCGDCDVLGSGEKRTYYLNLDENPQGTSNLEIYSNGCKSIQSLLVIPNC